MKAAVQPPDPKEQIPSESTTQSKPSSASNVVDGTSEVANLNASPAGPSVEDLIGALSRFSFIVRTEADLQLSIAEALLLARIAFEREVRISTKDRLDFLCGRVAIEAKTRINRSELIRQINRYAKHDGLDAIIVASTRTVDCLPNSMGGKPIHFALLRGYL
jgi:hypothetical protein